MNYRYFFSLEREFRPVRLARRKVACKSDYSLYCLYAHQIQVRPRHSRFNYAVTSISFRPNLERYRCMYVERFLKTVQLRLAMKTTTTAQLTRQNWCTFWCWHNCGPRRVTGMNSDQNYIIHHKFASAVNSATSCLPVVHLNSSK
jgi:hypothetical protein